MALPASDLNASTGHTESSGDRRSSSEIEDCGRLQRLSAATELARFEAAKKEQGLGFASPASGALVLANTLLGGSGMLGLPYAISKAGWVLGVILIVVFGCCSAFGSHLLQCSARRIGQAPSSFYSVATAVVPSWTWLIDGAVMVKCFGVGTSYIIIVGDLAPDAAHYFGAEGVQRWHAIVSCFALAGGLACLKNLSALRYTAIISVLIVSWTALLMILFFARVGEAFEPCTAASPAAVSAASAFVGPLESEAITMAATVQLLTAGSEALPCHHAHFRSFVGGDFLQLGKVLPVFIFAFTCQQNVFTVCNEVKEASQRRVDSMIAAAYLFSGVSFTAVGVLSYATYGSQLKSNALEGYPQGGAVQMTRLLFALLATLSYPLQVHPTRASALALWKMARGPSSPGPNEERAVFTDPESGIQRAERRRFVISTIVILALSLSVALSVKSLGLMLGVVGATGSTMVSYILPGLCYSQAFPEPGFKRVLAFCQLGMGCIIMPLCLVMLFV